MAARVRVVANTSAFATYTTNWTYIAPGTISSVTPSSGQKGTRITVAVTMGCGDYCPLVKADRREDWNIPDPKELSSDEFRKVRDLI